MGLGGILQNLKTEGVLKLYHDYRSGRVYDFSGSGNTSTVTSTNFTKNGALLTTDNSGIEIPANAVFNSSTGTMITRACNPDKELVWYLASKDTGGVGGLQFKWTYSHWAPALVLDVGGVNPTLVIPVSGENTHGISFQSGAQPTGYLNGVSIGSYTGNYVPVAVPTANLVIGNAPMGGFNAYIGAYFKYFLWISRILTATEHARVYGQLEDMQWGTKGLTPGPLLP